MFCTDKPDCRRTRILPVSCWLFLAFLCLLAPLSHAQSVDSTAPVIELEELTDGVADSAQVFTIRVEEDNQLREVTLYYRRAGQFPYTSAPMKTVGDTGYFSVSIPTDNKDLRTIEYYVKAVDASGNQTVSGFAFDPYRRTLKDGPIPLQPASSPATGDVAPAPQSDGKPPLLQRRWVQITLGVLAVGAIASLASDSGGDETRIVPLTFNVQ